MMFITKLNELGSGDYTSGGFSADEQDIRATASEAVAWSVKHSKSQKLLL